LVTGDRREKRIESEERKQRKRFLRFLKQVEEWVGNKRPSGGPETRLNAWLFFEWFHLYDQKSHMDKYNILGLLDVCVE
jgi:hypothetical protein